MDSKQYFIKKLEQDFITNNNTAKILELGSGQSRAIIPLLQKYPNLTYVGIEPRREDAETAKELLKSFPGAKIINQLAYEKVEGYDDFDVCFSLSVLEHVKRLERFLINGIAMVKPGGRIIHRYDLGHALYPGSIKERFQIFLGNNFPFVLPENKFVRYVPKEEVCLILEANGAKVEKTTYHQMSNHKQFLKIFQANTDAKAKLTEDINEWEFLVSEHLEDFDQKQKELIFPSVCVWARKTQ